MVTHVIYGPKKLHAHNQTRYPVVERAVGEFRARSDRLYPSEVRASLKSLLRDTQKREIKDEPGQYQNIYWSCETRSFLYYAARKVEESTKPPATVAASVVPPVPTEEQGKKRGVEDVKVEDAKKDEDEDAMDVEKISAQPPLKETTKHAIEHPLGKPIPTSTDRREAEDPSH